MSFVGVVFLLRCFPRWIANVIYLNCLRWSTLTSLMIFVSLSATPCVILLLGAVVDLSQTTAGVVSVQNKPSRISDLESLVQSICDSQTVTLSTLETLKGRLLYAAGHTFGRCTQLAIQLISKVSRRSPLGLLDDQLKDVIKGALKCLMDAKPRRISAWSGRLPIIVFTDGACEEQGDVVTHGATLYDPESSLALMFGDTVPSSWTQRWKLEGRKQLICQAELFPIQYSLPNIPGIGL